MATSSPPRWLLCQASLVQHPVSGEPCVVLTQVDISEAKQVRCQPPLGVMHGSHAVWQPAGLNGSRQ